MSSERVEAQGLANVAAAAKTHLAKQETIVNEVLSMRTEGDMAKWDRLDDVIMARCVCGRGPLFFSRVLGGAPRPRPPPRQTLAPYG